MITNNKKYRIKWKHVNNATNNQNNNKRPVSWTECYIYDLNTNELIKTGKAQLSQSDKNYNKAEGRYISTKRAMAGMEPGDQVDILESMFSLPSHVKFVKHS